MREINNSSASAFANSSSSDASSISFGTHGRSLHRDHSTADGVYKIAAGDTLWSVAKELLQESGHKASNKEIARLVRETATKNHINADVIKSNRELRLNLPPLHIEDSARGGPLAMREPDNKTNAPPAATDNTPQPILAPPAVPRGGPIALYSSARDTNAPPAAAGRTPETRIATPVSQTSAEARRSPASDIKASSATNTNSPAEQTPASVERSASPAASSDPYESSVPGRSDVNKATAIVADQTLSAEQKYKQSVPHFVAALKGASTIDEQAVQNQLVSTQKQLDALTSQPTTKVDSSARQNLEGQVALLTQLRAEPFNAQLSFAAGLNSIAHQLSEQAKKDPTNSGLMKQNADHLNNAAVTLLQGIGKNDPAYGGANETDTAMYKRVVDDGIANALKGSLIDIQKSSDSFKQEATRSFIATRIAELYHWNEADRESNK